MKKRLLALLLTVALCLTVTLPSFAAGTYVEDEIGLLDPSSFEELNQKAALVSESTGYEVRFLLTDELADDGMLYTRLQEQYEAVADGEDGIILGSSKEYNVWSIYTSGMAAELIGEDEGDLLGAAFNAADTWYGGIEAYLDTAQRLLLGQSVVETDPALAGVRLVDQAGLLTDREAEKLHAKLDEISERQGLDIVVVTVNSLRGKSAQDYADDYFDYNGYAKDGILLLIAMNEREWHISTTGYGITVVTDAGLRYMEDQFLEDLSDGEYAAAFTTFADLCDKFTTQANTGTPYDIGNLPKAPLSPIWILISLGVGLLVAAIGTGVMKSKLKSVRFQPAASNYLRQNSLNITNAQEIFLYYNVSRTAKPQSSSGGGSSTHSSSSGTSHGGGGGRF